MIVNYPPLFAAGKRVASQVSIIDVAPTLLAAAGIEIPGRYSGLPLQLVEQDANRSVLIQYPFYTSKQAARRPKRRAVIKSVGGAHFDPPLVGTERVGVVGQGGKLVKTGSDHFEFFQRAKAHGADIKVSGKNSEVRRQLEADLARLLHEHPLELIDATQVNDELLKNLRALGYVE